jgi:hypothetical protein
MAAEAAAAAACLFAFLEATKLSRPQVPRLTPGAITPSCQCGDSANGMPKKIPHCAKTGTDLSVPRRPRSPAKALTRLPAGWTERSVPAFALCAAKPVTLV